MSRPSAHLDRKLVAAARKMLPESGFSGLSVREVARRAGVNVGMFHYHFKSKKAFQRRVLNDCYEDFLGTFREAAEGPGAPRQRLRRVLVAVARFVRGNRVFYTLMLRELLNAQPEMSEFAKANFPRHAAIVIRLMEECRREKTVRPLPVPVLAMFAMSSMVLPGVAVTAFERNGVRALGGWPFSEFAAMLLSDAMIETRADMVMAAGAGEALVSLLLAALLASPAAARPPVFSLTLAQAEIAARAHSAEMKAAAEQSAAAKDGADAQFAALFPRLTLNGYYQYQAVLPELAIIPGQPPQPFGAQHERSIGPALSWTLWDEGALYKTWKAQQASARSADEQRRLTELQTTLAARLAYVQVQLAREQVRLLADSVALADAQYADVDRRRRAGAASRIDALSSHQEDLQRRADFLEAQAALASSLRALFQLIGMGDGLDLTRPVDQRVSALPPGLAAPTLLVDLDSLRRTPEPLAGAEGLAPDARHPGVLLYQRRAESAHLSAQGLSASDWPVIQLSGAIDYEYPNGPQLVYVTQKTIGLTASMPLFEMRQTARLSSRQEHLASAAERERDLAVEQLSRDWDKARATLASLRDEQVVDDRAAIEAEQLAHLVYLSYKAGRSTYLDVQTYDLAALTTKVQAAKTRAQTLIQQATLAELAAKE